jgi:hypothetical protein
MRRFTQLVLSTLTIELTSPRKSKGKFVAKGPNSLEFYNQQGLKGYSIFRWFGDMKNRMGNCLCF